MTPLIIHAKELPSRELIEQCATFNRMLATRTLATTVSEFRARFAHLTELEVLRVLMCRAYRRGTQKPNMLEFVYSVTADGRILDAAGDVAGILSPEFNGSAA